MTYLTINADNTFIKPNNKHSNSFVVSFALMIYMLSYYYIKLLSEKYDNVVLNFLPLGLLIFAFLLSLFKSFRFFYTEKNFFWLSIVYSFVFVVVYCIIKSGFERILGLATILICLNLFQCEPLRKNEVTKVLIFFTIFIGLIIINTSTVKTMGPGKFNPNSGGFLLSLLFYINIVIFAKNKKRISFLMLLAIIALQFVFTSRTSMLGIVIFTLAYFIFKRGRLKLSSCSVFFIIFLFSMIGLVVAYLYSEVLYPLIGHGKIFIFGKDIFTGRQTIWNFAFDSIKNNFFFGVGSHLNEEHYLTGYYELIMNAHNQPVGMLAAFGIFAFLIFYIFLSLIIARPYKSKTKNINKTPAIFFAIITLMSYFDVYLFSQYNWVPILVAYAIIYSISINYNGSKKLGANYKQVKQKRVKK